MEEYKVLITTSGTGSRLGDLTKYTNKSLVRIGKKPAISYIIEKYPKDVEFVITLGHYGKQVKDFLLLAYPDRLFNFTDVDIFEGEGSSLGYSMIKSKDKLQCPFIYHASDTIVSESITTPLHGNWIGYNISENYSSYRVVDVESKRIYGKDHIGLNTAYIGLAGINDYIGFWESLENKYLSNPNDSNLSDCDALSEILNESWSFHKFDTWLDVGNTSELKRARNLISDKFEILDKVDESIFLFDDFVIKFFFNENICKNRVIRSNYLNRLTPKILGYTENFYKYEYAQGDLLSKYVNDDIFKYFLNWSKENLWIKFDESKNFKKTCDDFYFKKTSQRLDMFFSENKINDKITKINGYTIPTVKDLINSIDKEWINSIEPYQFHGDYILDNIIYDNGKFILIDIRQDFGGDVKKGDIYYDLAKLNHNLLFNHEIVNKGLFSVSEKNGETNCDILRSDRLSNCREILHDWIIENNFDLDRVNLITSIIWLNMAPLHDLKIGKFLYYFGKLNLFKSIEKLRNRYTIVDDYNTH